jgi:hypothetical protein
MTKFISRPYLLMLDYSKEATYKLLKLWLRHEQIKRRNIYYIKKLFFFIFLLISFSNAYWSKVKMSRAHWLSIIYLVTACNDNGLRLKLDLRKGMFFLSNVNWNSYDQNDILCHAIISITSLSCSDFRHKWQNTNIMNIFCNWNILCRWHGSLSSNKTIIKM